MSQAQPEVRRVRATFGVWGEPVGDGVFYRGPYGKEAWSPTGYLSSALGFVLDRDVTAHPWDPWPKPDEPAAIQARTELFRMPRRKPRKPTPEANAR